MKKLLFIIILSIVTIAVYGQREKNLPMRASSVPSDTVRVLQGGSSIMLRSTLQGAIYDSLATHTDTLQALRADIDAGGSSLLLDSIAVHRIELDNLHDSITDHRIDIDANLDSIAVHRTELDNLSDSITDHRTDIDANTATGVTNGSNISANSVFIGVNTTDIGNLEDSITKHTDTLQVHQDQIAALQSGGVSADSSWTSIEVDTINPNSSIDANIIFHQAEEGHIDFYAESTQSLSVVSGGIQVTGDLSISSGLTVGTHIKQTPISHSLTDGAPTDAQIDAATGTTPAAAGSGWKRLILDSDGSALMYIIISDGSNWQYTALTIAL